MFIITIHDTEANFDDPTPKAVMDGTYETREEAEAFAQSWIFDMERTIPDFMQVFAYEVVPLRNPETMKAYFVSLIGLYNRAYSREATTLEDDM